MIKKKKLKYQKLLQKIIQIYINYLITEARKGFVEPLLKWFSIIYIKLLCYLAFFFIKFKSILLELIINKIKKVRTKIYKYFTLIFILLSFIFIILKKMLKKKFPYQII